MTDLDEETMEAILGSLQQLGSSKDGATTSGLTDLGPRTAPSQPYIEITEQPKQRDHRFRYPVEGRQAGSIMGERATSDLPSYPAIKVHNLNGRARVVVSLVTKDDPARPHPHRLVGDSCRDGVCTVLIDQQHPEAIFRKIGVQRTMNKEVENSLAERKKAGVRLPMDVSKGKTGKKHNYDMKAVRLHFEVNLETRESSGVYDQYLAPAVSSPVYDKKDTVLTICRVNIKSGTVAGGDELFILCEKVQSDDIRVLFSGRDPESNQAWNAYGIFGQSDVHRQFAVVCKTPKFTNQNIKAAVTVTFKLYRPSDEESSNEMEFTYKPLETTFGRDNIEKKKRKYDHKDEAASFNKYFTAGGQPFKTETLGASAQSCSGAPISTPVSTAPSTLTITPVTTSMPETSSSSVKESLRQRLLMNKDSGSRPSTPSGLVATSSGTATATSMYMGSPLTAVYTSEAHMSSGRLIQQQQPVSTDQGQLGFTGGTYDTVATAMLLSQAINQDPAQLVVEGVVDDHGVDEERQTSEQIIQELAFQLMSIENQVGQPEAVAAAAVRVGGNANVIVEQLPSAASLLDDIQFRGVGLDTLELGAIQDVMSQPPATFDIVYSQQGGETEMEVNHTSSSNNNSNVNPR